MSFLNIKKYYKKHWRWYLLIVLAVIFFISVSSFNYFTQDNDFIKWLSPDETANYIFAKLYGQESSLTIFEKYNLYVNEIIQPRSFRSDSGYLKPVSFLGLILIYGKIVSLTSYQVLPYLTPLFAAIGLIFYYLLIKKIWGQRNALISAFLLASMPAYIYYSARSMFHNVLFIDLLVAGLYFGVLIIRHRRRTKKYLILLATALSGSLIGLAATVRTSELLWLLPMLFILWIFNIKKIGFIKLILFLSFFSFTFLPIFYWNQILYGGFWQGGYPEMNKSISTITNAGADLVKTTLSGYWGYHTDLIFKIKRNIFYFGFKPYHSLKMFYHYFIEMFYWLFWPAVAGLIWFLLNLKKWQRRHWAYIVAYLIASLILLFYYGSWGFHDNPDPEQFTIGNSYTRYWLLIYLGAIPFVSMTIIRLTQLAKKKFYMNSLRIVIIGLIFFISIQFVLFASQEGLIYSAQRQKLTRVEFDKIINLTEYNSVIITQYHDKLFFPERKVIVGLFNNDKIIEQYAKLVNYLPVYYYNFTLPEKDLAYLNNSRLANFGLQIEQVEQVTSDFSLYRIEKNNILANIK